MTDDVASDNSDNTESTYSEKATQDNVSKTLWSSVKKALNDNDQPINIEDSSIMTAVFNLCSGKESCNDIITPENAYLMEQTIFINSPDKEFDADLTAVKYLTEVGYHPAALEGYLKTIKLIEDIKGIRHNNNNLSKHKKETSPQRLSFSYRHPVTSLRISKIDKLIKDKHLRNVAVKKLNPSRMQNVVKKDLPLTPKVKKVLTIVQQNTKKVDYFDGD